MTFSFKFIKSTLIGLIFSASCIVNVANAGLIVGDNYLDSNNTSWEYVGSFRVDEGLRWAVAPVVNGLEAALAIFGSLDVGSYYAISSVADGFVDHLAHYNGYGVGQQLFSEAILADVNGNGSFDRGESSAYVNDHSNSGVNNVFKTSVATNVPEPSTLAIFALGFMGLASRRFKKQS